MPLEDEEVRRLERLIADFGLWDWNGKLNTTPETVCYDGGYGLYLKPSADVVKAYFSKKLG